MKLTWQNTLPGLSVARRTLGYLLIFFVLSPSDARGGTVVDATSRDFLSATRLDGIEVDADPGSLLLAPGRRSGCVVSRIFDLEIPFDRACISWNADVPHGSRLTVELSVGFRSRDGGETAWSSWQIMGEWADAGPPSWSAVGPSLETGRLPRSQRREQSSDARVTVDVDTLRLLGGSEATALRYRLTLEASSAKEAKPQVHRVAVACWSVGDNAPYRCEASPAWGRTLELSHRAQRWEDPEIAGSICSPTSLAMVLEFFGIKLPTRELCWRVFDHGARIFGNWSFNVAAAGAQGVMAQVDRFRSLEQLEAQILAGRPVIISHRWKSGDLQGAPVASSDGHLVVVVGFTQAGDVVVNDPAVDPRTGNGPGRRVYPRRDIYRTWLENSSGIVYLIQPRR